MAKNFPAGWWLNVLSHRSPCSGNARVGQGPSSVTWTRFCAAMACSDFSGYSPTSSRDGRGASYWTWLQCPVSGLLERPSQPVQCHHFRSSQACGSSIPNHSQHRDEVRITLAWSTPLWNASLQRWQPCESRVRCSAPLRCNPRRMQRVERNVCWTCFDPRSRMTVQESNKGPSAGRAGWPDVTQAAFGRPTALFGPDRCEWRLGEF